MMTFGDLIDRVFRGEGLNKCLEEFWEDFLYQLKNNPDYWSNNKRKMHGLNTKRKIGKRSKRYYNKTHVYRVIEEVMDEVLPPMIQEHYDTFVEF